MKIEASQKGSVRDAVEAEKQRQPVGGMGGDRHAAGVDDPRHRDDDYRNADVADDPRLFGNGKAGADTARPLSIDQQETGDKQARASGDGPRQSTTGEENSKDVPDRGADDRRKGEDRSDAGRRDGGEAPRSSTSGEERSMPSDREAAAAAEGTKPVGPERKAGDGPRPSERPVSTGAQEGPRTSGPQRDVKPDRYTNELFRSKTKGPEHGSASRGYNRRSEVHQKMLDRSLRHWGEPGPKPTKKDLDLGHAGTPYSRLPPGQETTLKAQVKGENRSTGATDEKRTVKEFQEKSKARGWDPHDPDNPYYTRPKPDGAEKQGRGAAPGEEPSTHNERGVADVDAPKAPAAVDKPQASMSDTAKATAAKEGEDFATRLARENGMRIREPGRGFATIEGKLFTVMMIGSVYFLVDSVRANGLLKTGENVALNEALVRSISSFGRVGFGTASVIGMVLTMPNDQGEKYNRAIQRDEIVNQLIHEAFPGVVSQYQYCDVFFGKICTGKQWEVNDEQRYNEIARQLRPLVEQPFKLEEETAPVLDIPVTEEVSVPVRITAHDDAPK